MSGAGDRSDLHRPPLPQLGDAALGPGPRARAPATPTSASSGSATRSLVVRDGVLQSASDTEDLGFAVRVIHGGAWGFASGVVLTTDEAVRVAETAVAVGRGRRRDDQRAGRARRRAGLRRRHLGLVVRRRPVRGAGRREGRAAHRLDRPAAHRRRRRPRLGAPAARCRRTSTTPTWPAPAPPSSGSGCTPGSRRWAPAPTPSTRCAASPRRSAAAGSTSPAASGCDWDAELDEVPELLAEKLKAPSVEAGTLRPGHPPVEPVADHPRVDRPRHRARPGARLRGQLRRHVVRDPRQARTRCSTARPS